MKKSEELTKCPDCNLEYRLGAPHYMFCPARTCNNCMTTYSFVLPVYDRTNIDEDGNPERRCEKCLEEGEDYQGMED